MAVHGPLQTSILGSGYFGIKLAKPGITMLNARWISQPLATRMISHEPHRIT